MAKACLSHGEVYWLLPASGTTAALSRAPRNQATGAAGEHTAANGIPKVENAPPSGFADYLNKPSFNEVAGSASTSSIFRTRRRSDSDTP